MEIIIGLVVLWYLSGVTSFVYWWTSEFDLTAQDAIGSLVVGFTGPLAFLMGWLIHGSSGVIMKARK